MKILSTLAVLLLLSSCGNASGVPGGTIVQLFEWKWADVARECEEFLGPKGYAAVQVSPPQEHVKGPQWWTRYKPVSYQITSRGGSREQFADMVHRCRAAGVDIYVDTVINHMSSVGNGVGVAGNMYYEYNYPAVPYSSTDFHYCGTSGNDIDDYEDRYEVRNCELLNLADLATGKDYVRGKIAGYLNDLIGMGVAGYRIDAAKHIDPWDLYAISKRLNGKPYVFQEVVNVDLSDPVRPSEYFSIGDVTEFNYGLNLSMAIRDKSKMRDLKDFAEGSMFIPGDKSVVFVSNHDTERSDWEVLTFRDTKLFELANVFMLAYPYGYPKVMSSFDFPANDTDQGPPSYSPYSGNKIQCGMDKAWKCQHRWKPIANMVKFRYTTRIAPVTNWFSKDALIAFGRDDRGFVVINREDREITGTYSTNMRPGMYCNVIKGEFSEGKCLDEALLVDKNSKVRITVPALSAAAIHIDAQIFPTSGFTQMYVRGTFNNWGIMPMKLVHGNIWLAEKVSFKGNQKPEFKFDVYGDWKLNYGDNNEDFIGDRSGKNIRVPEKLVSTVAIGFNDESKKYFIAPTSSASRMVEGLKRSKEEL